MVEIPNSLRSLFSAQIEEQDGRYIIEIPSSEVDREAVTADKAYHIALLTGPSSSESLTQEKPQKTSSQETMNHASSGPPVEEGEMRDVSVEAVGDQGDGIAKVERGYVVIVPGTQPGDDPTVKIEQVQENVAFATVVDNGSQSL